MAEYSGVEFAPVAAEQDTAANTVQVAAGQAGMEYPTESDLEALQFEQPEDTEVEPTIEEILYPDRVQQMVDKGDDAQQPQAQPTKPETSEGSQQQPELPQNAAKAFSERLKGERAKIEAQIRAEYEQKYAPAREAQIEVEARKLMEANPGMNMTMEFAKMFVKAQQAEPAQQASPAQQQETAQQPNDSGFDKTAWIAEAQRQEAAIRLVDPKFSIAEYVENSPVFKSALLTGNSVTEALEAHKRAETQIAERVRAQAAHDTINAVRESGNRAMAPVTSGKGQQRAANVLSTPEEREKIAAYVKLNGPIQNPHWRG